jgi:uncharacterized protein YxjI
MVRCRRHEQKGPARQRARESYCVAVAPGQDDALVLAITVCIGHLVS